MSVPVHCELMRPAAEQLLQRLHDVEAHFGRVRERLNEARVLDLDLLAFHDTVSAPGDSPRIPHPRLSERAFVVLPLAELAPGWRHPESGQTIEELRAALPDGQEIRPVD